MNKSFFVLSSVTIVALTGWLGCAKALEGGSSSDGEGGAGGFGGASSSSAHGGSSSATAHGSTTSTTGATTSGGGETASSVVASSAMSSGASSTAQSSSSASSSSSSSSSSSGMLMCKVDEHVCSGMCAGNTIQTGCFGSAICSPCPVAPVNGTETCNAQGSCDFTCGANYMKSGAACVCALACCADSDCPNGGTCNGGTCVAPPACDMTLCIASCILQMKLGICVNNTCVCL